MENNIEEGKKLIISKRISEEEVIVLRVVNVHPSFIGIGKNGQVNPFDFKRLAQDLEPDHTFYNILNI